MLVATYTKRLPRRKPNRLAPRNDVNEGQCRKKKVRNDG